MATLYFVTDEESKRELMNAYRRGDLYRIRKGIYIDSENEEVINQTLISQWYRVAQYLFKGSIAAFRTADELRPINGRVYLLAENLQRRTVKVGPVTFILDTGNTNIGVEPFDPEMKRSNLPRQLLENLSSARAKSAIKKTLGKDWVEAQLVREIEIRGKAEINRVRDEAKTLATELGFEDEFSTLNKMVSALLMTHPTKGILQTRLGIARAAGEPYDPIRVKRFETFADYLSGIRLTAFPYHYEEASWRNLTFFESYFSNYIEGTQFTIDEAEEIAFSGKEKYERHEDSHDILSHVSISGDHAEMSYVPDSPEKLISTLKTRHRLLLSQRPDKRPGEFKEKSNKAGATYFVDPEQLEGTLIQGFDIYKNIPNGIKKALFMHFLVAECHPFDDGNGRIARIMMNAELVSNDLYKIIVPTVARENYLNGLRQASRQDIFRTMVKTLHHLHQYTALINWVDYSDARKTLETDAVHKEADEGLHIFNKRLSQFRDEYPMHSVNKVLTN